MIFGKTAGSELTREFLLFAVSTAFFQGSRLATLLLTARWTAPEEFGVWNALQLLLLYGIVVMLGVPNGMNRQVPYLCGQGREALAARVEDTSFWLACLNTMCADLTSDVAEIDPETLTVRELVRYPAKPMFFTATSALQVGQDIWIGSMRGDRIARYPIK